MDAEGKEKMDELRERSMETYTTICKIDRDRLVAQMEKNLPVMWETQDQSLGQEDPLEKGIATPSSIPAWSIPWMEELGRLQSIGSQRIRHD